MQALSFIAFLLVPFVVLHPAKRRVQEQLSPQLLTSLMYTFHTMSHQTNKKPEIFGSSLSSVLMAFCFPLAPQEHLVLELPQAGAEDPPLPPLEVSSTVCVSQRLLLHLFMFHSAKYSYSHLTMYISTYVCNSLLVKY